MNDLTPTIGPMPGTPEQVIDGAAPEVESSESILRHYWRVLLKRRWIILAITISVGLIGLAYSMLAQRQYAAVVTLEIQRESTRIINLDDAQPRLGANQEFYFTQYALLGSRSLAERVVRELRLADNAAFLGDYRADAASKPLAGSRDARERAAITKVMGHTEVIPVRLSSVVRVRYVSPDAQMASKIANSLANNFIQSNLQRRYDASTYAREFLVTQLNEMREKLEQSERQAVSYAAQQRIVNIAPTSRDTSGSTQELSLDAADLAALNNALAQARADRIAAEARYNQSGAGTAASAELQSLTVNTLRQQRAQLSAQLQQLLSNFGPEYPTIVALRSQIAELDKQISSETGRVGRGVMTDLQGRYRQALATEQQLTAQVDKYRSSVLDLRRRSIQYNIYQREVDTNRALYDALLQRYKEIGVAGGVGSNNISVVDVATTPQNPFSPNLRLNLLIALLVGLAIGIAIAFILDQLAESVVAPGEFQKKLGIPLLGAVPKLAKGQDSLNSLADRKSPMSEAYLSTLTGLQFSTSHGMPRSLLITSTQASEGKSTTSFALAQGLARSGKRVLLLDADMRNPSMHKIVGIANRDGLSSLLVGEGELMKLVHTTDTPNLTLLTAGHIPPSPAELLAGPSMANILEDAISKFDYVVIDGPPVLGLADAPLLATVVESTVFIMESGRTRATQARHAIGRLLSLHVRIAGAVLTKFDIQQSGYGYGYGYDYSYGG